MLLIMIAVASLAACTGGPTNEADDTGPHAEGCSPTVNIDNFSDALSKTTFRGTPVAGLSSLAEDTDGGLAALSDRSMFYSLDPRTMQPVGVVPVADESGRPLDSEGLAVD